LIASCAGHKVEGRSCSWQITNVCLQLLLQCKTQTPTGVWAPTSWSSLLTNSALERIQGNLY